MGKKNVREINPKQASKDEKALATRQTTDLAAPLTIQLAGLIDSDGLPSAKIENLPEAFKDAESYEGFDPQVQFETPGDFIVGFFVGLQPDVGPNHSRMYNLQVEMEKGKPLKAVGVWGSTVLDRIFDKVHPAIAQGDQMMVIFRGLANTSKPGQSPAKIFRILVRRADGTKANAA